MIQTATPIETRTCTNCWEEKPITDFRRRRRGTEKRHGQCRACYNAYMREHRAARRHRVVAKLARRVNSNRTNLNRIAAPCNATFRRFGGVGGFCDQWTAHLDAVLVARPGSKAATDSILAIVRLVEVCQSQADDGADFQPLSDADLEREIRQYVDSRLKKLLARQDDIDE
jgi:hypothetical protein